jgi:hypothetical protein
MRTNFLLGTLLLTNEARMVLKRLPYDLIARHAINEHGDVTTEELTANALSMRSLGVIVSRYKVDPTDPQSKSVRIETDEVWGSTTISIEELNGT